MILLLGKICTDDKYLDYFYSREKNVIKPNFIFEKTTFNDMKFSKGPGPAAKDIHLKSYFIFRMSFLIFVFLILKIFIIVYLKIPLLKVLFLET